MKKTKFLKKSILMMVCAVMLVFGAVVAINDPAEAASASAAVSNDVIYELGEGPAAEDVTLPENGKWTLGDDSITLAEAPECKDADFVFLYWEKVDSEPVETYEAGAKYELESDAGEIKFKAVWGVTVTYDANIADSSVTVTVPEKEVIPYKSDFSITEEITAENYSFLGWATESKKDAVTAEYKVGDVIKEVSEPITLYAVWKSNYFSVIYHANTGSDETDSAVVVPVDTTKYMGDNLTATIMGNGKLATTNKNYATMKDATPSRTGYTFMGWATTADATTAEYQPGATIATMSKDVDLYAVWKQGTAAATPAANNTKTSTTPQTGDGDQLGLYVVMAVLSLLGIGYLCYDQKKANGAK